MTLVLGTLLGQPLTAWAEDADLRADTATTAELAAGPGGPGVSAAVPPSASSMEDEEEIVVTGSRTEKRLSDAPVTTEVVGREELLLSGAENLTELLEEHPGVELERTTRGAGVRLLGLNPEHTLILIDGQRTTGRVGGSVDPFRFNTENIEQVEIVKGVGSALYGSEAMAGVINLISRRPKKPLELFVRGRYGSFDTVDVVANAGSRVGDLTTMFSGGYHRSNGFSLSDNGATSGAAYDLFNVENSTRYELSDTVTLIGRGDYRRADQEALDLAGPAIVDRTQRTDVGSVTVGPEVRLGPSGQLRVLATYSDFRFQIVQDQRDSVVGDDTQDIRQQLGQLNAQLDYLLLSEHFVSVGVEGIFERQGAEFLLGEDEADEDGDGRGQRDRARFAVFVQDEWTVLADRMDLSVVPSARLDVDSQFGSAFTPRLAVRYAPSYAFNFRVAYGWGFRAPTFEELYLNFLNPGSAYFVAGFEGLQPERAQGATLTTEYTPFDFLEFVANLFWMEVDDLIDTRRIPNPEEVEACQSQPGLSCFLYQNVSSARSRGVETELSLKLFPGLSLALGYVLTDTLDRANDRQLPGRALHKGTVHLSYRNERWQTKATVRSSILGERKFFFDDAPPGQPTVVVEPAAVTLDVRLEQGLWDRFSLFVGGKNLFDVGNATGLLTQPRTIYAGISAAYDLEQASKTPKTRTDNILGATP